jgi:hypothetical protein
MHALAEMQTKYLAEVETTYDLLEENFDALYERCESLEQRQLLRGLHSSARDAYWRAVATAMQDGNQIVREIYTDLVDANQQIKLMIVNLQVVDALLSLARQAVRLAAALISLAGV